jgi:hypothetical protein
VTNFQRKLVGVLWVSIAMEIAYGLTVIVLH